MKRIILRTAVIAGLIMMFQLSAFSQFTVQGELRPRFEYRNGYKKLPDSTTNFAAQVSQRSRLYFGYTDKKITTKLSFQDCSIWGTDVTTTNASDLGIYEAWAELPLCDSLSIKIGKQEISYDNERLLSASNWAQTGSTHNAVMLKYRRNGYAIDFAGAFNQNEDNLFGTNYTITSKYKTLNTLWLSKKFKCDLKISLLGIMDGYQKINTTNTIYMRGTEGGIIDYTKPTFSAIVRGFYQDGQLQSGKMISAYYFSGDFTYTMCKKFTVWLGMQYASGNNLNDTNMSNSFNTLYGSGHRFSGNMDYFSNISTGTKGAGLIDPYINFIYKFNDKFSARLDLHYFFLQNKYYYDGLLLDKKLGAEADLSLTYNFNPMLSLMGGFSANDATLTMAEVVGGDSDYYGGWGFVMLTIKPTFFNSDKK